MFFFLLLVCTSVFFVNVVVDVSSKTEFSRVGCGLVGSISREFHVGQVDFRSDTCLGVSKFVARREWSNASIPLAGCLILFNIIFFSFYYFCVFNYVEFLDFWVWGPPWMDPEVGDWAHFGGRFRFSVGPTVFAYLPLFFLCFVFIISFSLQSDSFFMGGIEV